MLLDRARNVDLLQRAEHIIERDDNEARRRLREERGDCEQLLGTLDPRLRGDERFLEILSRPLAQDLAQALLREGARLLALARIEAEPALHAKVVRGEPAAQARQVVGVECR